MKRELALFVMISTFATQGCTPKPPQSPNPPGLRPTTSTIPDAVLKNEVVEKALDTDFRKIFCAPHAAPNSKDDLSALIGLTQVRAIPEGKIDIDSLVYILFPKGEITVVDPRIVLGKNSELAAHIKVSDASDEVHSYVLDKQISANAGVLIGNASGAVNTALKVDVIGTLNARFDDDARTRSVRDSIDQELRRGLDGTHVRVWITGVTVYRFSSSYYEEQSAKASLTAGAIQAGGSYYNKVTSDDVSWRVVPTIEMFTAAPAESTASFTLSNTGKMFKLGGLSKLQLDTTGVILVATAKRGAVPSLTKLKSW